MSIEIHEIDKLNFEAFAQANQFYLLVIHFNTTLLIFSLNQTNTLILSERILLILIMNSLVPFFNS